MSEGCSEDAGAGEMRRSPVGRWDALPGAMEENRDGFDPAAGQTCRR